MGDYKSAYEKHIKGECRQDRCWLCKYLNYNHRKLKVREKGKKHGYLK